MGNIVNNYYKTGKVQRPIYQKNRDREHQKLNIDTMKAIQLYKLEKQSIYSIYSKEIQQKLVEDNVCTNANLPSVGYINMGLREIGYTYKKVMSVPSESQTPDC